MTTMAFDVRRADERHVWHPYTQHGLRDEPPEIVRAQGAYLYDAEGRAIFDGICSWWVTLHGHAQPEIADAIAEQARTLEQVIFAGFTHQPAAQLAAALVERAPRGLSRVFYSDDGSTAVEVAIKMAIQYWRNVGEQRRLIVALENAYHGDTFGAMSVSARGVFTDPFAEQLFDVVRLPDPVGGDVVGAFDDLLRTRGHEVAAIIVEPLILAAGGMRMWTPAQLRALRERAAAAGVLFIADEVMTGFGRTGPLFACEHAGIAPDLMCVSKGITGGFLPLGVTFATEAIFDAFLDEDRRKTLFHGHSYCANPIACAASLASLALLDDESARRRAAIEASHRDAARQFEAMAGVTNIRMLGTVLALDLAAPERGYLSGVGRWLARYAFDRGVLLRPLGDTVYIMPPYCATTEDLNRVYGVIADFVSTAAR